MVEPTNVEKLRALPWSMAFDVANTFFVQFSFLGSAFVLFLDDLALNKTQIGFILALFPFFGLLSLFIAPQVSRFGYKRTFVTYFSIRNLFTAGLLLVPLVIARFDMQMATLFVAVITIGFAISRSVAMTALLPWQQEYIPNKIRGKYSAYSNIVISLAGLVAVAIGSYILGQDPDLGNFSLLFGLGVLFGVISIYLISPIPGGQPERTVQSVWASGKEMLESARDRSFVRYLSGIGLLTLSSTPMLAFLPLYMQEVVGLSSGNVVLMQSGSLIGSLLTSYFWGWMADRFGSKPVMLTGLLMNVTLPVWWLIMPRQSGISLYIALAIAFLQGIGGVGWGIGSGRMLFAGIVPPHKKSSYLAVYNSWTGILGALSQLAGGRVLDAFSGFNAQVFGFPVDAYTLLFGAGFVGPFLSSLLLGGIRAEGDVRLAQFAGMFFHGNPLLAAGSLIRYYLAKDEPAVITVTERLGKARSPLAVDELLEALTDPRFFVRFEAIVSIARWGPDDRLLAALVDVMEGPDPALSVIAAWALGRMRDPKAIEPLRRNLNSQYHSVQVHAVRSLGSLGDASLAPEFINRLEWESDPGLQLAYASALGKFKAVEAMPHLLEMLYRQRFPDSQKELALAVARLVGEESLYVQLLRNVRSDPGTTLSRALSTARRSLNGWLKAHLETSNLLDESALSLARGELEAGGASLGAALRTLPGDLFAPHASLVLEECAGRLAEAGPLRMEYLILAIVTLRQGDGNARG